MLSLLLWISKYWWWISKRFTKQATINIAKAAQVYFSSLSKVTGAERNRIESRIASRCTTYGALGARCVDKAICLLLPPSRTRARCSLSCWKTEGGSSMRRGVKSTHEGSSGNEFSSRPPRHSPPSLFTEHVHRRQRLYDIPKNTVAGMWHSYISSDNACGE